ncbi:MAG TPA: hypothetical protein EYG03_26200 [Planctomycetes bacterium]|nr:hypothetical protein [Fuerstiella sp.]HIK95453.1 hypothetical protein [Planctomycetota bacterium]
MKPKPRSETSQLDLFLAQFDQLLNLSHPLCVLARKIDWQRFDVAFAGCYCPDTGAPGKLQPNDDVCSSTGLPDCHVRFQS